LQHFNQHFASIEKRDKLWVCTECVCVCVQRMQNLKHTNNLLKCPVVKFHAGFVLLLPYSTILWPVWAWQLAATSSDISAHFTQRKNSDYLILIRN